MNQATTTLYERLGRREGITRITADLMKNHLANPLVNARYMNSEDLERVERRPGRGVCRKCLDQPDQIGGAEEVQAPVVVVVGHCAEWFGP